MPRKKLRYPDQINFLAVEGTHDQLVAIAFYRGDQGRIGTAAKNMMSIGIESFLGGMSTSERRRYDEILNSVQVASRMKREGQDNHSPQKARH